MKRDLNNEKKDHHIADQKKEKVAANSIIYGMKGIKDGQYTEDPKGKRKGDPPRLQNPLCYPFIEPQEKGPE
jgi:hypothetical protein